MRRSQARAQLTGTAVLFLTVLSAACGSASTTSTAVGTSPSASVPSSLASPSAAATADRAPLLVVSQTKGSATHVHLVRLDTADAASVSGQFVSVTDDTVVILDGTNLKSVTYEGTVTTLGHLAAAPAAIQPPLVVSPDLSQWLYVVTASSQSLTAQVHLGTAKSDRVIATLASPDGNAIYGPFAWTPAGVYFVSNATEIGGAGAFLDYHFPLWRFNLTSGTVTLVTPKCGAYFALDTGTLICTTGAGFQSPGLNIRASSGSTTAAVSLNNTTDFAFVRLGPGQTRLALARNRGTPSAVAYQIATVNLPSGKVTNFGPANFVPDTWLPDGRLVADHMCVDPSFGGAPCDATKDGTYIFSADGTSSTRFFTWPSSVQASVIATLP